MPVRPLKIVNFIVSPFAFAPFQLLCLSHGSEKIIVDKSQQCHCDKMKWFAPFFMMPNNHISCAFCTINNNGQTTQTDKKLFIFIPASAKHRPCMCRVKAVLSWRAEIDN